jgi:hypothetical protein
MQPFQQEHRNQGCPNLDAECVLAGTDEALHGQILFQGLEQQGDIMPINIGRMKSRFTTGFTP